VEQHKTIPAATSVTADQQKRPNIMKLNRITIIQIAAGIGVGLPSGPRPVAAAASQQTCVNLGASTQCQTPGNVQFSPPVPSSGAFSGSVYGPFFFYDRSGR
jgi:hypothetical protein